MPTTPDLDPMDRIIATFQQEFGAVRTEMSGLRSELHNLATQLSKAEGEKTALVDAVRRMDRLPVEVAEMQARMLSQEARISRLESSDANMERWIGPDGYLRTKAFGGTLVAFLFFLLLVFGIVKVSDVDMSSVFEKIPL